MYLSRQVLHASVLYDSLIPADKHSLGTLVYRTLYKLTWLFLNRLRKAAMVSATFITPRFTVKFEYGNL